ncbi:887_t:CDS:2 [Cetraspora pellucida]|uniref:887_t:CDS:1 n=1 Tax=Cetraspora pellucida TaxID=1433469 RepID=A0ACA9M0U9_9GLOM|nr:887_t:CDS:2 [Cetraspora pellucida]
MSYETETTLKNASFSQSQDDLYTSIETSTNAFITELNKSNDSINEKEESSEEINYSNFSSFLEEVRLDYQNTNQTLRTSLDKFKDRYNAAKSKSVSQLSSFLYDLNHNVDLMVRVNNGVHIWVQVESIKQRKVKDSAKQKLPILKNKEKENLDPQAIPACKKRKISKKEHNLSKNIFGNNRTGNF